MVRHIRILDKNGKLIHTINGQGMHNMMNGIIGEIIPKKHKEKELMIQFGKGGEKMKMHFEPAPKGLIKKYAKQMLKSGNGYFSGTIDGITYDSDEKEELDKYDEEEEIIEVKKGKGVKDTAREAFTKAIKEGKKPSNKTITSAIGSLSVKKGSGVLENYNKATNPKTKGKALMEALEKAPKIYKLGGSISTRESEQGTMSIPMIGEKKKTPQKTITNSEKMVI